jgi:hypothetical protein
MHKASQRIRGGRGAKAEANEGKWLIKANLVDVNQEPFAHVATRIEKPQTTTSTICREYGPVRPPVPWPWSGVVFSRTMTSKKWADHGIQKFS